MNDTKGIPERMRQPRCTHERQNPSEWWKDLELRLNKAVDVFSDNLDVRQVFEAAEKDARGVSDVLAEFEARRQREGIPDRKRRAPSILVEKADMPEPGPEIRAAAAQYVDGIIGAFPGFAAWRKARNQK